MRPSNVVHHLERLRRETEARRKHFDQSTDAGRRGWSDLTGKLIALGEAIAMFHRVRREPAWRERLNAVLAEKQP